MRLALVVLASFRFALAQEVPFVGCASHNQLGPVEAPKGKTPSSVRVTFEQAERLAYYSGEPDGHGVLAPRGWDCYRTAGSSGATLYVSAARINRDSNLEFAGPAIVFSAVNGYGSGITAVAQVIARVFPRHREYVKGIIKSDLLPASDFPFGPWPGDRLRYKSNEIVEYETRSGAEGLGTWRGLRKNDTPIRGVAMLVGNTLDLLVLSVRLPHDTADLAPIITQQAEREADKR